MFDPQKYPVIQGGMGVGVSGPCLTKAVSLSGGIGTVSLTAAPHLLADALKKGDLKGDYRRALKHFPFPEIAKRVLDEYFVQGGIRPGQKTRTVPMFNLKPSRRLLELTLCASFALVWLSKEGHTNPVFVNLLEKIQLPHIFSLFGAMLAGVDGVVVGAGIPVSFSRVIDSILEGNEVVYPVYVTDSKEKTFVRFNPKEFFAGMDIPKMERPAFLPIVSSSELGRYLSKKAGRVDGLIIELPTAGGHNAPPRGKEKRFDVKENILYDPEGEDKVEFEKLKALGLPFWIGGSFSSPEKLKEALDLGACGIQVCSLFALCDESGIKPGHKMSLISKSLNGDLEILTSSTASPTGFPFKVALLDGSLSDPEVYSARKRVCNMGYLRETCVGAGGELVYRCPAEPVDNYVRKGGKVEDTVGRICLCNGLSAAVGVGGDCEPPIFTLGDIAKNANILRSIINPGKVSYSASDVMEYLLKPC